MQCFGRAFRGQGRCGEPVTAVVVTTIRATGAVTHRPACTGHATASLKYASRSWSWQTTETAPVADFRPELEAVPGA